jgi:nucleotide-binding universal stress UspA family protein
VFVGARTRDVDALVMGYGGARLAGGRAESALDELTHDLPCDVLVFDGETFDVSDILLPTAGGESSILSAEVATSLREMLGADVSLLHVADDESTGTEFLTDWGDSHGLGDATMLVETGDVEDAIERHARDHDLVLIGATERGLLSRVIRESLALEVLEQVETPVLMAERPVKRRLRERLFGR